jgi:hypothetical protein
MAPVPAALGCRSAHVVEYELSSASAFSGQVFASRDKSDDAGSPRDVIERVLLNVAELVQARGDSDLDFAAILLLAPEPSVPERCN